ncbi:hypothetical protein M413DRAFT_15054 [Hebeloma cylindrosporum]|uniref:LIM zinc-binding domain-containing protein n=1 Tax=Hebeloma cylindrosporum TaxID=76867 RepID=A0A0C2YG68_HEBCY|nr:hypothetical protein M413DRAFT_15054 [Hebeloma cylindrosporum h7]
MLASLLSPTNSAPPPRISQLLPSVKCSTCHQPVPLAELGEHTCEAPPPVPSLPKPTITPEAATALLPGRLQGRVDQHQRVPSSASARLRISTKGGGGASPTQATFQPKSSPLARSDSSDVKVPFPSSSPLRTRPPAADVRMRTPSILIKHPLLLVLLYHLIIKIQRQPHPRGTETPLHFLGRHRVQQQRMGLPPNPTSRPAPGPGPGPNPYSSPQPAPPPSRPGPPPASAGGPPPIEIPPDQVFVPPAERGIDTKSGGAAGMAGVGRRGFAAAARAAMFVGPPHHPQGPQPLYGRRMNGYSSHSPGPTSPLPQSDFSSLQPGLAKTQVPRTPSPGRQMMGGAAEYPNPTPPPPPPPSQPQPIHLPRNPSSASSKSAYSRMSRRTTAPKLGSPPSPIESESEYGGLAYADSTDYEEDDDPNHDNNNNTQEEEGKKNPTYDVRESLVQALNGKKGSRHIQFGSVSLRSRSRSSDVGDRKKAPVRPPLGLGGGGGGAPSRADSVSSYSSSSSAGGDSAIRARARADSTSSTVARALGLSQTPPSEYAKLGGPGVKGLGGRMRSASGASSVSNGSRSLFGSVSSTRSALRRVDTAGSSSTTSSSRDEPSSSRSRRLLQKQQEDESSGGSSGVIGRSNTVPGHPPPSQQQAQSAEKPVKLPTRSLTSPQLAHVAAAAVPDAAKGNGVGGGGGGSKKTGGAKKVRTIEDGRWVSVDGGGVLCERCWKNMYLPKCRRCNLPIERAAVSSSDGQLKGKYHKECFNCHTCQKPFPDKTFYVYDGKPLCAYHYHEANDSLCAAARCGQPIEGPCAVSHAGDRYHPEHMTCEFPGGVGCRERLVEEYWEVEGRMLCERHANTRGDDDDDERGGGDEERWAGRGAKGAKAMKRVTRFIDLAGGGGVVGAGALDGSGLR